jgi:polyhydroxybutyrate depolymerase
MASLKSTRRLIFQFLAAVLTATGFAAAQDDLTRREWTIDGVAREAMLHVPATAKTAPAPLVFVFHGHGGSMKSSARSFHIHTLWPEAIVVYPQGLNTPGRLTDPEGKLPGWQATIGDQGDRDLKFFDTVLASLQSDYKVDDRRIYSTGHSNGGGFTYLLWAARGDVFAALAPSAAVGPRVIKDLKPKPVLHIAGEQDQLVKYDWQQQMMQAIRKTNECDEQGTKWDKWCTLYPSKTGTPVVTFIHPGTHAFTSDAPPIIVKFFKAHAKP